MTFSRLLRHPVELLAFGLGAGLSPKAPGTVGTLAALPFYAGLYGLPNAYYVVVVLLLALTGIWICGRTAKNIGTDDPAGIVWDEIVGMLCALIALPADALIVLLAFILFRIFDILKPWPIGWCDEKVHGGLGIMLDDILAGLLSCAILHVVVALGWLPLG